MIKVVDLFSGAGGLTFGFKYNIRDNKFVKRRSYVFSFANELDRYAAESFRVNFPNIPLFETDIKNIDFEFIEKNNIDISEVDLIIGGPPCQSFSTIGKRVNDDRANLYTEFNRLLKIIKPRMFLFENVTGILSMKDDDGNYVLDNIRKTFNMNGYRVQYKILNAVDYGVAQFRQRVFIVGVRKDINTIFKFPKPLKNDYITLENALSDLPILTEKQVVHREQSLELSSYQRILADTNNVTDHFYGNYGQRMIKIIEALDIGESKKDINRKVEEGLLDNDLYLTSGYNNTYGRLWWDRPGYTITNSLGRPSSIRCIHPYEMRTLTVREGARIQSFPDSFKFSGSKTQKEIQIGNAVPPILSVHLANAIIKFFKEINRGS